MPNVEKVEKVAALKERIQGASALLLAEYRGLSVHDATELRRSLSDTARFSVVKNTLMQRAVGEAGIDELQALLTGPTAVAFVQGDIVTAAKKVAEAARRFPSLVLKGAYVEGKVLDQASAQALASLESREVMLSTFAGMVKSEMSRAASMFQSLQGRFLGLLEAYRDKLPSQDAAGSEEAVAAEPSGGDVPPQMESTNEEEAPEGEPSGSEETSEAEGSVSTEEE